ncbi:MAG: hypothetical protein RLZ12_474 [Bacillota bacterium]|jgi:hypothetical protein
MKQSKSKYWLALILGLSVSALMVNVSTAADKIHADPKELFLLTKDPFRLIKDMYRTAPDSRINDYIKMLNDNGVTVTEVIVQPLSTGQTAEIKGPNGGTSAL